jgi:UDP-GlcNAc3NAcA epimerase
MEIPEPQYRLGIQSMNQGAMIGKMLEGIENAAINEKPDIVLVYGDDNSALAGALAANKLHIPVAHVEAGLRSFNMRMPEEVNRILIDRISNLLFCSSAKALENLKLEGYDNFPSIVHNTGDVLQDAAIYYSSISSLKSDIINRLNINQSYALATISRHENIENPTKLKGIINALNLINRDQQVIAPLHPSILKYLREANLEPNFKIIPLLNYFDMVELLKNSNIVLTDGYGVQREAFFFGKCCVTLRNETEWTELVQNGYNMLGSTDTEFILIATHEMLNRKPDFSKDLYGNGKASERIAEILKNWYGEA